MRVRPLHTHSVRICGQPADAVSIAKEVVIFDTARGAPAFAFFYIFVLRAGVAHQLQFPVQAAAYAIGLVAKIAVCGHSVIASDLMGLAVESAPAWPAA